ncbi:AlpA family transcriptional regulator [Rhizobium sp. AB2/73]|uniref:helix-turn-helix transcriptional regulator n=1 Tax=Rhizobium sp. AB2/73 TaxID=2795216 RepID=UPI001C5F7B08|nr:AlpA family transcriptional regulator [Rhizobium sp. AB2/73]QYA14081.1 AlpA family transcriptional regulator [Rhizobium sp. AB2/73]UEQ79988.1 AlpA family transcriptional regulator [Rhizobium sp. AB2/73]
MDYDFLLDGEPIAPKKPPPKARPQRNPSPTLAPHNATINKLLRIRAVLSMVGVSRPTIYRLIAKGEFPKPVTIGAARLWPENEINQWLTNRIEDRDR